MSNTHDLLRQRFHDACNERETMTEAIAPLRKRRDDMLAKAQLAANKAVPLTQQIKEMEAPLYELHNEIATISRALNGKTAG
jgi:uncharacterized coiled-coil DUF342 family protein